MKNEPMTPHSSLAGMAAPPAFASRDRWAVAQVGAEGREAHIMRFTSSRVKNPLVSLTAELGFLSRRELIGRLVLPGRLKAAGGVRLLVDDMHALGRFEAVPPAGRARLSALVKLAFDERAIERLEKGAFLHMIGQAAASGKALRFSAPLEGFSEALGELRRLNFPVAVN